LSDAVKQSLKDLTRTESLGLLLLVVAVVPALCEELAFRGFILSGLRHLGHTKRAIALSSLFFALAHTIFQQSLLAFIMGLVIGYLAVQTGSLLPGVLFHMTHNALGLLSGQLKPELLERARALAWLVRDSAVRDAAGEGPIYRWPVIAIGAGMAFVILLWFRQLPHARTREEALQEAIDHSDSPVSKSVSL
jgi:sodium transport system permease protein